MPDNELLRLDVWEQRGALVVRPRGELDTFTYPLLRDSLLRCVADEPTAVLVELGDLRVRSPALLSVFVSVWLRCSTWTTVPLVLAATREPLRSMLRSSGVQRFVTTVPTLAQARESVDGPPQRRRVELRLGGSHADGPRVRDFVRSACERWHVEHVRDDAVLVTSALVDNAIDDGCGPRLLRLELRGSGLAVSVRGDEPASSRPSVGPFDQGGSRGLAIVAELCLAWGRWSTSDGGELAWAVLPLRGRDLATIRRRRE